MGENSKYNKRHRRLKPDTTPIAEISGVCSRFRVIRRTPDIKSYTVKEK